MLMLTGSPLEAGRTRGKMKNALLQLAIGGEACGCAQTS
jgi:hypothetical protein